MQRFQDRVVLVTGGASGIGQAIAEAFAAEGAKLAILDLNGERAEAFARELEADGIEAAGFGCDVSDEAAFTGAIDRAVERFGRLDVLI
ncbi:MAG TPA: SDR family NAD(P)-dependent oxidoreductase, partial [Stenomitos sp.]